MKILLVDDDPGYRALFFELASGYEITCATGYKEGLRMSKSGNWDLLVLDLVMPDGSGLDLFEEIKTLNPYQRVVLVSGFVACDIAKVIFKKRDLRFYEKPVTEEKVQQLLHDNIEG